MAVVENRFVCDLSKPVQAQALKGNVFSLDNFGSRISVLIYNNGQPATISGSITANCILPDGSTVNVNGTLTTENGGSKAYIDVPQGCLLIPGILKIAIKCTSSSVITTLAAIVANVYMTKTDNVITPSQQIITDWNAEISASLANQDAEISDIKSAVKQLNYFDPSTITSGYVISYNGSEVVSTWGFCSDYIDIGKASKISVFPQFDTSTAYLAFYDEFKELMYLVLISEDTTEFEIPHYVKYIRISGQLSQLNDTIVKIENEFENKEYFFKNIQKVKENSPLIDVTWLQKNILPNGHLNTDNKMITTNPFMLDPYGYMHVTVPSGYSVLWAKYNSAGTMVDSSSWMTSDFGFFATDGAYYRLCAKHGTADILPSEGANIVIKSKSSTLNPEMRELNLKNGKHRYLKGRWLSNGKFANENFITVGGLDYTTIYFEVNSGFKVFPVYFNDSWEFASNGSSYISGFFSPASPHYGLVVEKTTAGSFTIDDCGLKLYCMSKDYAEDNIYLQPYNTKAGKHKVIDGNVTSNGAWSNINGLSSRGYYIPDGVFVDCDPTYGIIPAYYDADGKFISQGAKWIRGYFKPTISPYVDFIIAPYSGGITVESAKFEAYHLYPMESEEIFSCSIQDSTTINRTQHGENEYIRIPAICVLNDQRSFVAYEVRHGSRNDDSPSNLGYSIIGNFGGVESYGLIYERKADEARCFNPQLLNDGTTIHLFFSTYVTDDSIRIYYATSTDAVTWSTPVLIENTTISGSMMMTSPANPIIANDEIVCPIYVSNEIISQTGEGYYSGIMVYDAENNTFTAKVCTIEGTNECQVIDDGDYIILSCRDNINYGVVVLLTTLDMSEPFVKAPYILLPGVTHITCQEAYKKVGNDIYVCRPEQGGRKDIMLSHANVDGKIEHFDFYASHVGKNSGGYSAIDYRKNKYVVCCEDSINGQWGELITVCSFVKNVCYVFNK